MDPQDSHCQLSWMNLPTQVIQPFPRFHSPQAAQPAYADRLTTLLARTNVKDRATQSRSENK